MSKVKRVVRGAFDPIAPVELECGTETPTKQSMKAECDVNNIVAKFQETGVMPNVGPGMFADVSEIGDYRNALEQVEAAENLFMALPASKRAEFQNDPALFLDWMVDPANASELGSLGYTFIDENGEVLDPAAAANAAVPPVEDAPAVPTDDASE